MGFPNDSFKFVLNARPVCVSGVAPQTTLLSYIRAQGCTGAKEGCAEGECGACAVLMIRESLTGSVYQSVNSCLVPLPDVAGREILTVEALAEEGHLAEVQSAMAAAGGSQCGYCTPGFVVSMFAEQHRREDRPVDIHAVSGNLCRCTGYRPIRDAMLSVSLPREGQLTERLRASAPDLKPVDYETESGRYSRPCGLAACLELASASPEALFVAGNTDLGVVTNLRDQRFPHLISLDGVPELREFDDGPSFVDIGAGLTLTEIGERWRNAPRFFGEWLGLFASPLIRNRATLGGNLATASPIGDSAPLLLALDAEMLIAGIGGERTVALADFFHGYRRTSLNKGEIICAIRVPKPLPDLLRFYKVAKRRLDDISTVAAAIALRKDRVTIGFGGVAAVPVRIAAASLDEAAAAAAQLKPISDHRGSAEYRSAMAVSLVQKFVHEAGEWRR